MEWFYYLLKVSACTAFFFAFYLLVLRKLTFFKINRFYLLFALMISFVIPTLHFTVERELAIAPLIESSIIAQDESLTEQFSLAPITATVASLPVEEAYNWFNLLPFVYITVVIALLGLATWRFFQLINHAKQNTKAINGLKLVSKSAGYTNCSFFSYVFIDEKSLTASELQIMLRHEEVHAKQYHSVDKIILIVVKAVLWFNPIVYLYDKALEQIHEYEADEVTSQNFGTAPYANLLLRLAVAKSNMPLVHNFVKSPIKERIKMLFNSKSKHMKKLLYLLALPIGMGLLWGFTVDVVEVPRAFEACKVKMNKDFIASIANPLWGKTIEGKIKSILQTEVGEILNFKYGRTTVEIFNSAKGKVKIGDELWITISGTVNDITVKDGKGNIIKKLEKPCYGTSFMKTKQGEILYQLKDLKNKLITKTYTTNNKGIRVEQVRINTLSGKAFSVKIINGNKQNSVIWIYVNDKLYSETEALRFNPNFIAKLPLKRGYSVAADFNIPAIGNERNAYVFWFGNEPKLSEYTAKNRTYWKKYNGKTVEGKVIGYTFSPTSKVVDGFLVKTTNGETLKANVEAKFATQTKAMIGKNDLVSIKIYNANYFKDSEYPVLTSYKISKGGKLLFDRWPKVASNVKPANKQMVNEIKTQTPIKPILVSASSLTVDTKANMSYVKNGKYNIGGVELEAKESTFDTKKNTIKANKATITKNGHMIVSDEINIDANANYFKVKEINEPFRLNTFSKIKQEYFDIGFDKNIKYTAKDSINVNRRDKIIMLYGNATIEVNGTSISGTKIVYNNVKNTARVINASMKDKESILTVDSLDFDFNTKNGRFYGKNKISFGKP